jgi:hypothetical protein
MNDSLHGYMGSRSGSESHRLRMRKLPNEAMRSVRQLKVSGSRFEVFRNCETNPLGQIRGPKERNSKEIQRPKSDPNGGNHSPPSVYNDFTKRTHAPRSSRRQELHLFREISQSLLTSAATVHVMKITKRTHLGKRQDT